MPDWLGETLDSTASGLPVSVLAMRLGIAFVLGCLVAGIYRVTMGRSSPRSASLMATLVLLTILIGMVTLVIGNSVARAFSLVGALSIVRFRTVVEDTRDTAFVIFAVAVGMAAGAGYLAVPLVGIPLTGLAAFLFRSRPGTMRQEPRDFVLTMRVGLGRDYESLIRPVFEQRLESWSLTSTATVKQGAAMALSYAVRLRSEESAIPFVSELNGLEGIHDIELRQL